MIDNRTDSFYNERERLMNKLQDFAGTNMKRFLGIDEKVYLEGALPSRTKEMLGFIASLVLRCDDCITYHLIQLKNEGVTDKEFEEIISIGLVVGGSITIPHVRRAVDIWLAPEEDGEGSPESARHE